jgi:phage terminase Nu1 subunit (DNA packaging protein)
MTAATATDTAVSQAEFARLMGCARSWVTTLKGQGRLVLDEAGRVLVEASKAKIAASNGADERAMVQPPVIKDARERKEQAEAHLKEIELAERMGKLMSADQVVSAVSSAAVTLRSRLESLPDILAPQLAAINDEQQIRALMADQIEHLLAELSAGFEAAAKVGA